MERRAECRPSGIASIRARRRAGRPGAPTRHVERASLAPRTHLARYGPRRSCRRTTQGSSHSDGFRVPSKTTRASPRSVTSRAISPSRSNPTSSVSPERVLTETGGGKPRSRLDTTAEATAPDAAGERLGLDAALPGPEREARRREHLHEIRVRALLQRRDGAGEAGPRTERSSVSRATPPFTKATTCGTPTRSANASRSSVRSRVEGRHGAAHGDRLRQRERHASGRRYVRADGAPSRPDDARGRARPRRTANRAAQRVPFPQNRPTEPSALR